MLAKRLPILDWIWHVYLNKDQLVWHNPILLNLDEIFLIKVSQSLNDLNRNDSLLLVKRRDVNASDHLLFVGHRVVHKEDLTIALPLVKRHDKILIVP